MKRTIKRRTTKRIIQRKGAPVKPPARKTFGSAASGKRVKAVIDHSTGMNKTETAYSQVLDRRVVAGEILEWRFEPMRLRLADNTFYTPDFAVQLLCGTLELIDVKGRRGSGPGGWEDDARVKIKVAAETYHWFRFVGICKTKGGWHREEF